jgi:mxaJ protein
MSSGSKETILGAAVLVATVVLVAVLALRARQARAPVTHIEVAPAADAPGVAAEPGLLRVCADPNNLPFSNARVEGFENRLAAAVARSMGMRVAYDWRPQRRGFVRTALEAGRCDVVMGVPAGFDRVRTTRPYYASTFVFVTRREEPPVASFDDPRLRRVRIGIPLTGDDYANPPAAQALARRQIADNVTGFTVFGDYSQPDPPRGLIDAVANGSIDVAVAWGPVAGYFAGREPRPLRLTPVTPDPDAGVPFTFAIAMGVRRGDAALAAALDRAIADRRPEIDALLAEYAVPRVPVRTGALLRAGARTGS